MLQKLCIVFIIIGVVLYLETCGDTMCCYRYELVLGHGKISKKKKYFSIFLLYFSNNMNIFGKIPNTTYSTTTTSDGALYFYLIAIIETGINETITIYLNFYFHDKISQKIKYDTN